MIPNSESQMDSGCPSSELAPYCQAAPQFTIPTYLRAAFSQATALSFVYLFSPITEYNHQIRVYISYL